MSMLLRFVVAILFLLPNSLVLSDDEVAYILDTTPPPAGVVFEVLTHEESSWPKVLDYIKSSVKRLRAKHKDMAFAIVSHGMEEFALLKENKGKNTKLHSEIKSLRKNNIKLEVCGTFAEWNGHDNKDFPDYVTVVDQAPTSIQFYEQDGFEVIVITEAMLKGINKK